MNGEVIKVPEYAKIKIGDTIFSYGKKVDASWRDIIDYVTNTELTALSENRLSTHLKSYQLYYIIGIIVLFTILVIASIFVIDSTPKKVNSISDVELINSKLKNENYISLKVMESDTSEITITGFLMTNKEKSEVENIVDLLDIPVIIDISTGDNLAAEVRELYRVNGVEAEVKALKYGTVVVTTKYKNKKKLDNLKHIALNEIPSLTELDAEYIGKEQTREALETISSFNKEGKRIIMVVDGAPPYLMTFDRSKYYVGALLPSGHKIESIIKKQVKLVKHGKTTILEF
jgi:type III secretion protein D